MKTTTIQRKRNMYDIFARILKIAKGGAQKTRIMYLANLSFDSLQDYLAALIQLELIEVYGKKRHIYRTSEKGMAYLAAFEDLKKTIS